MHMYSKFEGFPPIIVHCLGWCHIMTPYNIIMLIWEFLGGSFFGNLMGWCLVTEIIFGLGGV